MLSARLVAPSRRYSTTTVSVYMTVYITNRYRLGYVVVAVKGDTNPLIDQLIYSGVTWP